MKEKSYAKGCVLFVAFLVALVIGANEVIKRYEKRNHEKIALQLSQAFGFPVTFSSIALSWQGALSLQKVVILDSDQPIPFIEIQQMDLFPDWGVAFKERRFQFNSLFLQGLKLRLGGKSLEKISLLGLQGEPLATTIDYVAFIKTFDQYHQIKIQEMIIDWDLAGHSIRQRIDGKVKLSNTKDTLWLFSGKQSVELSQALYSPSIESQVSFRAKDKEISITLETLINMQKIFEGYHPISSDPSWLPWLKTAIPTGTITKASMHFTPNKTPDWQGEIFFKNASCDYAKPWPAILNASGKININAEKIEVELFQGQLMNVPITNAQAILPLQQPEKLAVNVTGKIASSLEKGVLFLQQSPLSVLANDLLPLELQGHMDLSLNLSIPLVGKRPVAVGVEVLTQDAALKLPEMGVPLTAINGVFQWCDGSLKAKNVKMALFKYPLLLQVETFKNQLFFKVNQAKNNEVLFALSTKKPKEWRLEGPLVKGTISLAERKKINIALDYLKLPTAMDFKQTDALFEKAAFKKNQKEIQFFCHDLEYGAKNFNGIGFSLIPTPYGYEINEVTLDIPDAEFSGTGEWHFINAPSKTLFQGKLGSPNLGNTLLDLGYATAIREAKGTIDYQLQWPGNPLQFKVDLMSGNANLRFDKGRILGVEPGLGRIMGLLNLQSIQRRLQLDFSDLFKKGFVFDNVRGQLLFEHGIITTDSLKIDGPASKIELSGKASIAAKSIDLMMVVKPHMSMGLPLAAAIAAGNPAVGAGVWLLDRLTGSQVKKISQHRYHVTGTWETPMIQPIDQKNH